MVAFVAHNKKVNTEVLRTELIRSIFYVAVNFKLLFSAFPARTMLGVNSLLAMTMQFGKQIANSLAY